MALHLITGHAGTEHVTPNNAGHLNAHIVGSDNCVFEFGRKFEYNLNSNNEIRIYDGQGCINGRHFELVAGTYEDLSISNGEQNMLRHDLVVARYQIDADTGIETAQLVVIEGTSASEAPQDPDYNNGSVLDGDSIVDFPLYRIIIDGLNVTDVEQLFTVSENIANSITEVKTEINELSSNLSIALTYNPDTDYFGTNYGGEWHDVLFAGFQTHYLYNLGDEIGNYTGGWITSGYTFGNIYPINGNVTKEDTDIKMTSTNTETGYAVIIGTNNKIDLSNFSSVNIECTRNGTTINISLNVTGISTGYICVTCFNDRNGSVAYLTVSEQKEYIYETHLAQKYNSTTHSVDNNTIYLKKVWLE